MEEHSTVVEEIGIFARSLTKFVKEKLICIVLIRRRPIPVFTMNVRSVAKDISQIILLVATAISISLDRKTGWSGSTLTDLIFIS
jgi:hypothetical protein